MHVLLESGARREPARGRWTFVSAATHAGLITAAIVATAQSGVQPTERVQVNDVIYVAPRPVPQPHVARAGPWSGVRTAPIVIDVPRIAVPGQVDLSHTEIYPSVLGELRGNTPAPGPAPGPSNGVFSEAVVERTVAPRSGNPTPAYPAQLRSTGLQGTVVVRFVVDTTGSVEQGSIAVLEATHSAFADAVRSWLPRTRYFPAELSGRHVRQLVQQRVEFELK